MANVLTDIMPKILARGLMVLREQAVMPRLVNSDYSTEAAEKGDTIDVPISTSVAVTDVTPANVPPADVDTTPTKVQILLNKWKEANFHLTDKEMTEIDRSAHFLPLQTGEAVRALANQVNADIHAEYLGVYGYTGTAGTTPFATTADAINARKLLHQQRAFRDNRRGVLDFDAEASALALAAFADAEKTGENGVKIEGEIGRKYGIQWVSDDNVATHTAGTGFTGTVTVTGANAIGAKTINLTTAAASAVALLVGDIITIAGDTQTYVITADATIGASTTGNILIEPGLAVATAGTEVPTAIATHVVNLAFHRDAFAFATRPLQQSTSDMSLGNMMMSMQDPQTGIVLRLEVSRQHKQVKWSFDMLYGTKLVRPQLATRIAG